MNNFLVIGDPHFNDKMPYAEFVSDGRVRDRENVFSQIYKWIEVDNIQDVVILGDVTDKRNPSTYTYDLLFEFLSNIRKKLPIGGKIYILVGNHDSFSNIATLSPLNKILTALDIIIIDKVTQIDDYVFLPYRRKSDYGVKTNEELRDKVMQELDSLTDKSGTKGKYLFSHVTISNFNVNGQDTSLFDEMVLDNKVLNEKYDYVFNGHIHEHNKNDRVINMGNMFTSTVGDSIKVIASFIHTDDGTTLSFKQLEQLHIKKLENPKIGDIIGHVEFGDTILKIYITKKYTAKEMEDLVDVLSKTAGYQLIEKIGEDRSKKINIENGLKITDLSLPELVELYGKQKNVNIELLKKGLNLIQ